MQIRTPAKVTTLCDHEDCKMYPLTRFQVLHFNPCRCFYGDNEKTLYDHCRLIVVSRGDNRSLPLAAVL